MQRMMFIALALLGAILSGCGLPFHIETPTGFARTEESSGSMYQYRAIAAYGLALSVRSESNEARGDLDFWTEAIDRTLRRGPYHPTGTADARSGNGVRGRRLEYRYGDREHGGLYWVVVFVTEARVFVLEAGGEEAAFTRGRASVERAIGSFVTR